MKRSGALICLNPQIVSSVSSNYSIDLPLFQPTPEHVNSSNSGQILDPSAAIDSSSDS